MALLAGSVSIEPFGSMNPGLVSGSGLALELYTALVAYYEPAGTPTTEASIGVRAGLAGLCTAVAAPLVAHITTNAVVEITASDSGLQRDPTSGSATLAPSTTKTLGVK